MNSFNFWPIVVVLLIMDAVMVTLQATASTTGEDEQMVMPRAMEEDRQGWNYIKCKINNVCR